MYCVVTDFIKLEKLSASKVVYWKPDNAYYFYAEGETCADKPILIIPKDGVRYIKYVNVEGENK